MSAEGILAELRSLANPENVAGMARYGISSVGTLGVPVGTLRGIARRVGRNHVLAQELWSSGVHEARILASIVAEPKRVTPDEMERWVVDLDSWDTCDQCCTNLWVRTPHAREKALAWRDRDETFVRRAGFTLIAQIASKDKTATEDDLLAFLPVIERGATDDRNFVKKAVSWALRELGQRTARLNAAAIETAERLRRSDSRSARWVGTDALRELRSDKVRTRVAARSHGS